MLVVQGSPRAGGNSQLLAEALAEGAQSAGALVEQLYLRELAFQGCTACGGCDNTGQCVLNDDMQQVYPQLQAQDIIVLAVPMFFYGPPAIAKAFIDRAQALWNKRALARPRASWSQHEGGTGYLLGVGATKGEKLFMPTELICRYFYDALDMDYGGGLFFRNLEHKAQVREKPDMLKMARDWGVHLQATGKG